MLIVFLTAITIGFVESRINVPEPPNVATTLEIILAKQDNIRSQQTFLMDIEVQDPSEPGIGLATPSDDSMDNDFSRFATTNTFRRRFEPCQQTLTILFVTRYEGPEGFQLSLFQVEMDSDGVTMPNLFSPIVGSTLFPTTLVVIDDNDGRFTFDHSSMFLSQSSYWLESAGLLFQVIKKKSCDSTRLYFEPVKNIDSIHRLHSSNEIYSLTIVIQYDCN